LPDQRRGLHEIRARSDDVHHFHLSKDIGASKHVCTETLRMPLGP
jgi:hypothetical protein